MRVFRLAMGFAASTGEGLGEFSLRRFRGAWLVGLDGYVPTIGAGGGFDCS